MDWVNYHHLLYFWTVARTGSIALASEELMLAQPTVSGQIKELERSLGVKLFDRVGRGLVLTETGRTVFSYADEIFSLGREMMDTVRRNASDRPLRLHVGVADVVPKLLTCQLLEPVVQMDRPVHLICREGKLESLVPDLASLALDLIISDGPLPERFKLRAHNHALGHSKVFFYGSSAIARRLRAGFPDSLDGESFLLPTENNVLRTQLDAWFERREIKPSIVGEFDDSALMKVFGQSELGILPAPNAIESELKRQYRLHPIGEADGVFEHVYAITLERKLTHPGVIAICDRARVSLANGHSKKS